VREVSAAHMIVKDLEDQVSSPNSLLNRRGINRKRELEGHLGNITTTLKELEDLVTKYSSLGLTRQRTWDRIRFASKNIRDIRGRLTFYISNITFFMDSLAGGALVQLEGLNSESRDTLVRIERILSDLVSEVKLGFKEPSLLSENEDDSDNVWDQLRHELECEGLSAQFIVQYKSSIQSFLKTLLQESGLEDLVPSDPSLDFGDLGSEDDQVHSHASSTGAIRCSGKANEITHGDFIIGDDDSESTGEDTTLEPYESLSATSEVYDTDAYKVIGSSGVSPQGHKEDGQEPWQSIPLPGDVKTRLNTYIYEYFLKAGAYQCARALVSNKELSLDLVDPEKQKRTEALGRLLEKEQQFAERELSTQHSSTETLQRPNLPTVVPGGSFLEEWWLLFWDMFIKQRRHTGSP
jgi:hypothetical protein